MASCADNCQKCVSRELLEKCFAMSESLLLVLLLLRDHQLRKKERGKIFAAVTLP